MTILRIRLESEAIIYILAFLAKPGWHWIGSRVLREEITRNPDPVQRSQVQILADLADETVEISPQIANRARDLEKLGFRGFDALHIACTEASKSDILLTTDDRLLRLSKRLAAGIFLEIENPLEWVRSQEYSDEEKNYGDKSD